jgi:hypothetical protein
VQDQAELEFSNDVQGRVAFLWLEGVNRDKDAVTTKVRRTFFQAERIGATQQDEKHTNQVQHLAFGDGQVIDLGQQLVNLHDCPALPESPVANLDNDFQREAIAAHCQATGHLRFIDPITPSAVRIRTTVAQAHHQVPPIQEDNVLAPQRITTFQGLSATWANGLIGSIVALGHLMIVFCSSHLRTFLTQGLCKTTFYLAEGM